MMNVSVRHKMFIYYGRNGSDIKCLFIMVGMGQTSVDTLYGLY